jgi:hypothetical protein
MAVAFELSEVTGDFAARYAGDLDGEVDGAEITGGDSPPGGPFRDGEELGGLFDGDEFRFEGDGRGGWGARRHAHLR